MGYKRLNYLKRCQIQALWKAGFTQQKIADEIGVDKSTICREFKRNMVFIRTKYGYWDYKADYAQSYADEQQKNKISVRAWLDLNPKNALLKVMEMIKNIHGIYAALNFEYLYETTKEQTNAMHHKYHGAIAGCLMTFIHTNKS